MNFFVFEVLAAFAAATAIVHNEQLASVASTRPVGISGTEDKINECQHHIGNQMESGTLSGDQRVKGS